MHSGHDAVNIHKIPDRYQRLQKQVTFRADVAAPSAAVRPLSSDSTGPGEHMHGRVQSPSISTINCRCSERIGILPLNEYAHVRDD
jgi:hypothetical protein